MEDDPKTLEEAIKQINSLRSCLSVKLEEIRELNKEITRLEARASEQGGEMQEALARANDVLRSAHAIAKRQGQNVSSWAGFLARIDAVLKEQHVLLQSYWAEQSRALLARDSAEPALEEHDLWIDTDALPPEPAEEQGPEVGDVVYIRWLNGYQEVTTYSALLQAEIRGATVVVLMRRGEVEARIKDTSKEEER